jgi:sodium/potassium-transporting ATPase subunit alpha
VHRRLYTSSRGLSDQLASSRIKEYGRNVLSEPPSRWLIKTLTYLYGGFGSILFVGAILVFVSWKPLGQPPAVANLALAIVLVIVWVVQAALSWHQGLSTCKGDDIMGGLIIGRLV